jgi:hypothetical protein
VCVCEYGCVCGYVCVCECMRVISMGGLHVSVSLSVVLKHTNGLRVCESHLKWIVCEWVKEKGDREGKREWF